MFCSQQTVAVPKKRFRANSSHCSNTGKVIFKWCKQVADNWDTPWSAQQPLPRQSAHVGHVRIVDREAKDPDEGNQHRHNQKDRQGAKRGKTQRDNLEILISERPVFGLNLCAYIPFHLSAPEYVFLLIHEYGEVLVLALLDGIRPGGDGPHLVKLSINKGISETSAHENNWLF